MDRFSNIGDFKLKGNTNILVRQYALVLEDDTNPHKSDPQATIISTLVFLLFPIIKIDSHM